MKKGTLFSYDLTTERTSGCLIVVYYDNSTKKEALSILTIMDQSHAVRAAQAINILDDISQDSNMPAYTRTRIWNIVSLLEVVK